MNQEVQQLNVTEIIDSLFEYLKERERDVLTRRYGLKGNKQETLEKIGKDYGITRERVRQIEANSIKKLNKIDDITKKNLKLYLLADVIEAILRQSAGVAHDDHLVETLIEIHEEIDRLVLKQSINFLLTHILKERFERIEKHPYLSKSWKLKEVDLKLIESIIQHLIDIIDEAKVTLTSEELIERFEKSEFFQKNRDEIMKLCDLNHDNKLTLNEIIIAYLSVSEYFKKDLFDNWGLKDWKTVSPKTVNDKIYLVLKKAGKPLHYKEIAKLINEAHFDDKKACAATVHNELIIDDRYVLVGRGHYALREWGYEDGTVEEIIERYLKERKEAVSKQEIIDYVLSKKLVKASTVYLALLNKKKFKKVANDKFTLIEK